jgi:predicted ABC-type exoprotein transport system permease subunit
MKWNAKIIWRIVVVLIIAALVINAIRNNDNTQIAVFSVLLVLNIAMLVFTIKQQQPPS